MKIFIYQSELFGNCVQTLLVKKFEPIENIECGISYDQNVQDLLDYQIEYLITNLIIEDVRLTDDDKDNNLFENNN